MIIAGNTISLGDTLDASTLRTSLGLANAMHFRGVATVSIADGSTTDPEIGGNATTLEAGDVVIDPDNAYEYVWDGSKWERLGQDASTTYDSGAVATNQWVARIQQNSDRTITTTLGTLDTSGTWSGNAATATKWAAAQKVYVTLGTASTTTTIQGGSTSAQTIGVDGTLKTANGGTGNTSFTPSRLIYSNTATKLASGTIESDGNNIVFADGDYSLSRTARSGNWNQGVSKALIKITSATGAYPLFAMKSHSGHWLMTEYESSDFYDHLIFGFLSDVDVYGVTNAKNHYDYKVRLIPTVYATNTETVTDRAFVTAEYASNSAKTGDSNLPVYINASGVATTVTAQATANNLINALSTGSTTPVDADYYISQYVGGGTTTTTYHRRPMSALWAYIKGHITSDLYWANIKVQGSSKTDTIPTFKTIYFGSVDPTTSGRGILTFSSTYPNHGLWYFNDSTDIITLDGHGKANSKTEADLAINALGDGIISTRNRYIPHTNNTTGTVGTATRPVYVDAGTIKQGSYELKATVNAGTATRLAYYSGNNAISSASNIQYIPAQAAELGTTKGNVNGLFIYGAAYGNTAANLGSNTVNVFRYGDPGPQIRFSTALGTSNAGATESSAIIWSDNTTSIGTDQSFHFVGQNDASHTASNVGIVTNTFIGKTRISAGVNYANTNYVLFSNGTTGINGQLYLQGASTSRDTAPSSNDNRVLYFTDAARNDQGHIYFRHNTAGQHLMYLNTYSSGTKATRDQIVLISDTDTTDPHYIQINSRISTGLNISSTRGFAYNAATAGTHISAYGNIHITAASPYVQFYNNTSASYTGYIQDTAADGMVFNHATAATTAITALSPINSSFKPQFRFEGLTYVNGILTTNGSAYIKGRVTSYDQWNIIYLSNITKTTAPSSSTDGGIILRDKAGTNLALFRIWENTSMDRCANMYVYGNSNNAEVSIMATASGDRYLQWTGGIINHTVETRGLLKSTYNSNTVTIGSQNASFTHIYNSANIPFIFNKSVLTAAGDLGNTDYPWNNIYLGKGTTRHIYFVGSKATTSMIRFLNETTTTYGNGISIGGGGLTIIGGGESASSFGTGSWTAETEEMVIVSDNSIWLEAGANTIANRTGVQITTAGHLLPVKAEAAHPHTQNIGSTTNNWYDIFARNHTLYAGGAWYGDFHISVLGTADTQGVTLLRVGNGTATGTANNSQGKIRLYATNASYTEILSQGNGSRAFYLPNYAGAMYAVHAGDNNAVGNSYTPIYAAANGRVTSCSSMVIYSSASNTSASGQPARLQAALQSIMPTHNNSRPEAFYLNTGNGSVAFGYTLYGDSYNTVATAYGGYFIAHYNIPRYQGIQGGTWSNRTIVTNATNAQIGNATTPVYVDANGVVQTCTAYGSATASTATNSTNTTNINMANGNGTVKYFVGVNSASTGNQRLYYNSSIKTTTGNVLLGAAWNDYAEFRQSKENKKVEPGKVVYENGDDTLSISTERLMRGCSIVSDTYGFGIGESEDAQLPIAVSGRVLAYPYENKDEFKKHIGWPVCSGPNGTVSIMTEEEEMKYPSRIIGIISAVPDYEIWHGGTDVIVDGRVWIKVR